MSDVAGLCVILSGEGLTLACSATEASRHLGMSDYTGLGVKLSREGLKLA